MAGNSLDDLKAWMENDSRMFGWDMVVALDGRNINRDLQQDHILRLSQGNDLGSMDMSIDIPDSNFTQYLSGVKLDAPALSFHKASLQSPKIALNFAVAAGNLMMVERIYGEKQIVRLSSLDPLDGPQLLLDLPVEADSRSVMLDLAHSEDVLLTLFHTPTQQREAGKHFLERFKALNDQKRLHTLARLPEGENPFMCSQSVEVRPHKRVGEALASQAINEEGELLIFASMADGRMGGYPGDNSGYRSLIPDPDGEKTWSGTALFSQALIHRAAFGDAVLHLLDDAQFERVRGEDGMLTKMVANSGALQVPARTWQSLDYEFESDLSSLPATGGAFPLTVEFGEDHATQHWQSTFTLTFKLRPIEGTSWQGYTATFNVDLEHQFHFSADELSGFGMEGELFTPYGNTQEVTHVSGLPENMAPELLERIKDFVAQTVKRALLERFADNLTATGSETFLTELDIIGDSLLQATDVAKPLDLAMFGQIHSSGASFSIVSSQPWVAAGKTLQLSTAPVRSGLIWTVENLSGSGSNPGSINELGVYQAPPKDAIQGNFNQVLAIASDPDTGERSASRITVMSTAITVNPQIQTCFHGARVELSAGHMGTSPLSWAIKNPVVGESGTVEVSNLPEGDHAYKAGPKVDKKAYVLEEIEVTDSQTGDTGSAWVLVIQQEPNAHIKLVVDPPQPEGQIKLQAIVNGNLMAGEWSLPLGGPGSIDESGLYISDPLAKEHFVLIKVMVDGGSFGKFEGHRILPLPLTEFPTVIKALAE